MRQVQELSQDVASGLERMHRSGSSHRERVRAHAILLSSKGFEIEMLAVIFSVDRDTVRDWLDRFEQGGVEALRDAPKPGRPRKITAQAQGMIRETLQSPTPNFRPLLQERLKKGALWSAGEPCGAP